MVRGLEKGEMRMRRGCEDDGKTIEQRMGRELKRGREDDRGEDGKRMGRR
jgi:hypothetical protein